MTRLPSILRADYRRFVIYPRLAWLAVYGSFGMIAAVAFGFMPWK